jgi:transposase-like protein
MAVNNENQHEQAGDYRSRPRWSAGKKMEAVLRLLRGEPLEVLSRELGGGSAPALATWRDDFLEGGKDALKGQRPDRSADDRALRQAERKVGQLTNDRAQLSGGLPGDQRDLLGGQDRLAAEHASQGAWGDDLHAGHGQPAQGMRAGWTTSRG